MACLNCCSAPAQSKSYRALQVFFVEPLQVIVTEHVRLVGFRLDAARRHQPGAFLRRHLHPNLVGDGTRHLALQLQHVGQFAVVTERPQQRIFRYMNQTCSDP
jgi:hypothetical protein